MLEYMAYISDFIPFRGYDIVIRYNGYSINGVELGKNYTTAIERLREWAEANGYKYGDCGTWFKDE